MQITMRSKKYYVHFALVFATTLCVTLAQNQEPKVNTTFGSVRGVWFKTAGKTDIAGFLGLPYALPPVGDLRFENPQPWTEKWNYTRNATTDGSMCLQLSTKYEVVGDEDCLYLNVFTPTLSQNRSATAKKKLSVIVFIHGGTFNRGSSNSKLYAPTYLLDHEIVLVTLNYRLNVFGFFSTGNDVTPGNYGLKDIAMAVKWIHDNVEAFGGDPNSVTLLGLNAGAVAVELLSANKATEGHFQKMITMSGWATAPWAFHTRDSIRNSSMSLAYRLKCNETDDFEEELGSGDGEIETTTVMIEGIDDEKEEDIRIVQCLKNASAIDIVKAGFHYAWRHNPLGVFGPTLEAEAEGAILTVHPTQAPYRDMPWITGVTNDEGLIKSIDIFLSSQIKTELLQHYNDYLIPYLLELENIDKNNTAAAIKAINDYYFSGDVKTNIDVNITQMYGDRVITWPSFDGLRQRAKNMKSNVYFYQFGYTGTFSNTFEAGIPINLGVCHGDDLNYLFPYLNAQFADLQYSNSLGDNTTINVMSEMWTNFAKTGEPSARLTSSWEPYQKHARYMKIGDHEDTNLTLELNFLPERMAFWDNFEKNYSTPITEYRVGGSGNNESSGGNNEGKDGEKGKGGAAGVQVGLTVFLSLILCWTSSLL